MSNPVLSPSEIKLIQEKLESLPFLSKTDKDYFRHWTNPRSVPGESEFKLWHQSMVQTSETMTSEERSSIIKLGIKMAQSGVQNGDSQGLQSAEVINALKDLHHALGLTKESDAILFSGLIHDETFHIEDEHDSSVVDAISQLLDGDHPELKDKIRRLLQDPVFEIKIGLNKEEHRKQVLEQVKALAKQGLSAYSFPKKYGGYEKRGHHIAVFEMLGYGDLSLAIKFGVQFGLFGGAVHMLGTESHHEKYIEPLHQAKLLGCFAMTETGHGSNVKNLETTAHYDHDTREIIIHSPTLSSGKEYIGNALHSSMAVVFAQLIVNDENLGVHAIMVPVRDASGSLLEGVTCEDNGYKMGLNGVDNGKFWFNQVRVPVENLLNKYGHIDGEGQYTSPIDNPSKRFFTMLGALVVGRICVGLISVNAAKVALTIALNYGSKRKQFAAQHGKDETIILDYPTHQKRLFPLLAKNYAYYFALQHLAEQYSHAEANDFRKIETLAAGLKSKASWYATQCIQVCREACGGKGYLSENRFAALKADSDIFTTFEGDNTVLMQLVAKGLLTEFKQTFHDDGYRAVLRMLLTKVKHETYENNPLFTRNTDVSHLLDQNFHFHAFNYRKRKILISLSERMRKYLKRGMDPYQAFLKVQNHMIDLADAYIDQVTLTAFHQYIDKCKDEKARKLLLTLAHLYALETIQEQKGWFLETDYLNGSKTKAIRRVINKLYQEIRPHALELVDAFNIPNELVAAPIAFPPKE